MHSLPARRGRTALAAISAAVLTTALLLTGTGSATAAVTTPGTIVGQQSGRCVDVTSGGTANGTVVQIYDCNGSGAQQWQVGSNGSITNPQSGKCLDANGSANNSYLQIWACGGTANQQWTVNGTGGGGGTDIWSQLKAGWNLGNSFDATPCETCWGNPATTKAMIDQISTKFNFLRIPVTWYPHLTTGAPSYTVDPAFLARLKQVIDWAVGDGMYVDVNMHHDGGGGSWLIPSVEQMSQVEPEFNAIWSQVAAYFNGEDQHLLFEAMNEPQDANGGNRYGGGTSDNWPAINTLNQDFVNDVRANGGNDSSRWLLVTPYGANAQTGADNLVVPNDSHVAVSVHTYNPWAFCSETAPNYLTWDGSMNYLPDGDIDNANRLFTSRGIHVAWTEFGATVKPYNGGDNSDQVANFETDIASYANQYGQKTMVWDNGSLGIGDDQFGLLNRNTATWQRPNIVDRLSGVYP
ncbi:MAG TPA: cellulase family glycosylhydrolase [Pseudonocardiaceae bacterium]